MSAWWLIPVWFAGVYAGAFVIAYRNRKREFDAMRREANHVAQKQYDRSGLDLEKRIARGVV